MCVCGSGGGCFVLMLEMLFGESTQFGAKTLAEEGEGVGGHGCRLVSF